MQYGLKRKDSHRKGYLVNSGEVKCDGSTSWLFSNISLMNWLFAISFTILFSCESVFGQFMVHPIKLSINSRPNRPVVRSFQLTSYDPNTVLTIDLDVLDLTQSEDGGFLLIDPDPESVDYRPDFDMSKLTSCKDWITLDSSTVDIAPAGLVNVGFKIDIPRTARGFYCAGIIAKMNITQMDTIVPLVLRVLVPVLVEVEGRNPPTVLERQDFGMEFIPQSGQRDATINFTTVIQNNGNTFNRVRPVSRLWAFQDEHWRLIHTANFDEIGILPGVKLTLEKNILRTLPTGKYKMANQVYVDGRLSSKIKREEKEFMFEGDPSITRAAADAPLELDPRIISVSGNEGTTRAATVEIHNAVEEPIKVQVLFGLPDIFEGKALSNGLLGQDLNCAEWLRVKPQEFTLGGYDNKRIQIYADIPDSVGDNNWYYALMGLYAFYTEDGTSAGLTKTKIAVNSDRDNHYEDIVINLSSPTMLEYEAGRSLYFVKTQFSNVGSVHANPVRVRAALALTTTRMIMSATSLQCVETGIMLPFETRQYSGVLDLSALTAGVYALEAMMEYAPERIVTKQINVRVSIVGNQRIAEIIGTADEIREPIQIEW